MSSKNRNIQSQRMSDAVKSHNQIEPKFLLAIKSNICIAFDKMKSQNLNQI